MMSSVASRFQRPSPWNSVESACCAVIWPRGLLRRLQRLRLQKSIRMTALFSTGGHRTKNDRMANLVVRRLRVVLRRALMSDANVASTDYVSRSIATKRRRSLSLPTISFRDARFFAKQTKKSEKNHSRRLPGSQSCEVIQAGFGSWIREANGSNYMRES